MDDEKNLNTADIPKEEIPMDMTFEMVCDICSDEEGSQVRLTGTYHDDADPKEKSGKSRELVVEHVEWHSARDEDGEWDYYTYMVGNETHISRVPAEEQEEAREPMPERHPDWTDVYGVEFDPVDHPEHYAKGTLECIDWIRYELTREEYRGYLKGCMMKYLWRHEDKGKPVQDLEKLRKYAEFLIDDYEREEADENLGFEEPGRFVPENPRAALSGVTDLREAAANMMECAAFNEAMNRPLTNADLCDALGTMVTIAEKHYAKLPTEKEVADVPER